MGLGNFVKKIFSKGVEDTIKVEMTRDQIANMQGLIEKERRELARKMHDVVDKGSLEGKTILVRQLFNSAYTDSMSPFERSAIDNQLQTMLDRYGESMPANTAHRMSHEMEYGESDWSDNPACHERYLRNRDGSIFYSPQRRVVTIDEIWEAQEKDKLLVDGFNAKFDDLIIRIKSAGSDTSAQSAMQLLQDIQLLQDDLASIAGPLNEKYDILTGLEEKLIEQLSIALPEQREELEKIRDNTFVTRIPFLAQLTCDHAPIPAEDAISAMMSDGIETIRLMGTASRIIQKLHPTEMEFKQALDEAVNNGLRKELASQMLSAWAGYDE